MDASFAWRTGSAHYLCCASAARSWADLRPALVAAWVKFADVLGPRVAEDTRSQIDLSFFSSSGRVTFNHARRETAVGDLRGDAGPAEPVWCVACKCDWIEEQWYAAGAADGLLGELGVAFAGHCLLAASDPAVRSTFRASGVGNVTVTGRGATQSPAAFRTDLESLFAGTIPELRP